MLAGESDTETIHTEHGTRYGLDPAAVMFSPGNQAERARMGEIVEADERVFDMFAGIGYFTLPMARAGARVTATELNPTAFRYLENAMLNDVPDRVDAYMTDCRDLAERVEADRVVMGYYGSSDGTDERGHGERTAEAHEFLPTHSRRSSPVASSTTTRRPRVTTLGAATRAPRAGRRRRRRGTDARGAREAPGESHSAGVAHCVIDARLE